MLISICIITFKRPEGLKRLLESLNQLAFSKIEAPEIEVVVVDNDTCGIAAEVVNQVKEDFRSVSYTHLTLPTICSV